MLCKKSKKNLATIFHKTWKTSFWAHFGSLWPKNPKTRFYSKRQVASLLKLNETLTSRKKTKKFLQLVPNINSRQTDKQPNGQMDWGTSQDLHFEGLKRKIWSIVENIVVSIIYTLQNAIFNEIWRQTLQNKMFIGVLYKLFWEILQILQETTSNGNIFRATSLKNVCITGIFYEFCLIFQNNFFMGCLQATVSGLKRVFVHDNGW